MTHAPALHGVTLALDAPARAGLGLILAVIMFGVALGLSAADFRRVAGRPRLVLLGVALQLGALPAVSWALAGLLPVSPSLALGMIVVAACPGGSVSNFLTQTARN